MMTHDQIIAALDAKCAGDGRWSARCPAHEDDEPSLSIGMGRDGKVLLTCHAGCSFADIMAALMDKREIKAIYDYTDERGNLLFQVVRFEPKDFSQRRPDGRGGWVWKTAGVRRVLYRLPDVRRAVADGKRVYIAEGEKDVESLVGLGFFATTNPGGAGKWRAEFAEALRGARVVIVPDSDEPGRRHAEQIAASLHGVAKTVKVVNVPAGKDVTEWLERYNGNKTELLPLVKAAAAWEPPADTAAAEDIAAGTDENDTRTKETQAAALVKLALSKGVQLFHDCNRDAFAVVPVQRHVETYRLKSRSFYLWLQGLFYGVNHKPACAQALHDALGVLECEAIYKGDEHAVHVRVAGQEGRVYLDLCNAEWQAVEISETGWKVVNNPPVRFRRAKAMMPLPVPVPGGNMELLRPFVNVTAADWPLLLGCLVAALRPTGPYPALILTGEQGSSKSTISKVFRALVDPNTSPVRAEPKEQRDLAIAAGNAWTITLDNVSHIPAWLSDALCRLSTGGGFSTRTLFENDEETIFDATRPVVVNAIEEVCTRADLLDRAVLISCPVIPDDRRMTEQRFWRQFGKVQALVPGALLDAVAAGLRSLRTVKLASLPRMADFARWAVACEPGLGLPAGTFLSAYTMNVKNANVTALDASVLTAPLIELLDGNNGNWTGTATELLDRLGIIAGEQATRSRFWPKQAHFLTGKLNRLAPNLRKIGIEVESGYGKRTRKLTITRRTGTSVASVATSVAAEKPDMERNAAACGTVDPSTGSVATEPGAQRSHTGGNAGKNGSVAQDQPFSSDVPGRNADNAEGTGRSKRRVKVSANDATAKDGWTEGYL
jgi:hypothetical protein